MSLSAIDETTIRSFIRLQKSRSRYGLSVITVCGRKQEVMEEVHSRAKECFLRAGETLEPVEAPLVSPLIPTDIGGFSTFFVAPNGSISNESQLLSDLRLRGIFLLFLAELDRSSEVMWSYHCFNQLPCGIMTKVLPVSEIGFLEGRAVKS